MNVVHMQDYIVFRKHLCIGFELLSMNLFEFLKVNDFNVSSLHFLNLIFIGLWPQLDTKICHPTSVCAKVLEAVLNHSLRFKTWKHYVERTKQVWHQNDWFRKLNFYRRKDVHLYLVKILQSARNNAWHSLWLRHRYVELWMYHGRALHRLPDFPRRKRTRLNVPHHGDRRHTYSWYSSNLRAKIPLL